MPELDETGVHDWIRARLAGLGHVVHVIERPHVRPWGSVFRIDTDAGVYWCKAPIPPLRYELPLLAALGRHAPDRVPRLAAADAGRGWMLLEDAGPTSDDVFREGPPLAVWEEFLAQYAELQIAAAPAAEELLAAGVPDRRSPVLVDAFLRVLGEERLVRPLADDALGRLRTLAPKLEEAIDVLAALGLPDSVQHDDLHPWNVCVSEDGFRFLDWGDACVAQPLLSLYVPLNHVPDGAADRARDAYLEPWTALRPRAELVAACDSAVLLGQVTGLLKWDLINAALTDEERAGYEDVIPKRLGRLLEHVCA